jgi:pantetheine-phosphate adenylyltransferase
MRKAVVGGTFAFLHKGHRKLLSKAFSIGDSIYIGLTTDKYVKSHKPASQSYRKRRAQLIEFASKYRKAYKISPLRDKYGPTLTEDFDYIIVSPETVQVAREINAIRKENHIHPIRITIVGYTKAYDGKPISSTRIARGEIDGQGRKVKDPADTKNPHAAKTVHTRSRKKG